MENEIIEKLNVSNIDELYDLLLELADHHNLVSKHFKGKYPSKPIAEIIAEIKDKVNNRTAQVDIIRMNKIIIALAIYNVGNLEYLIISKNYRNKGYGQILMDNVMAYFTKKNVKRIEIRVVHENNVAMKFYKHYGFQTQSEIMALYLSNDVKE